MFCTNCGQKIIEDSKFCHKCGFTLYVSDNSEEIALQNEESKNSLKEQNLQNSDLQTAEANFTEKQADNTDTEFLRKDIPVSYEEDYYIKFRDTEMGKRDGWAWVYGVLLPSFVVFSKFKVIYIFLTYSIPDEIKDTLVNLGITSSIIVSIICIGFFYGKIWARNLMFAIPVIEIFLLHFFFNEHFEPEVLTKSTIIVIMWSIVPLIIYALVINKSVSNRAFFRLLLTRHEVSRLQLIRSNLVAHYTAFISLSIPVLIYIVTGTLDLVTEEKQFGLELMVKIVFTLIVITNMKTALKARSAENLQIFPPIGGKGAADVAVISSIVLLIFLGINILVIMSKM